VSTVTEGPSAQVDLEPGETLVGLWPVEPVREDGSTARTGWLVLSTRRLLFYRAAGVVRSTRLEKPAEFAVRLEEIRALTPAQYSMSIGYGDRVALPGLRVDARGFRLRREANLGEVLPPIERARQLRRAELRLPLV
jgi:hypothetical protein